MWAEMLLVQRNLFNCLVRAIGIETIYRHEHQGNTNGSHSGLRVARENPSLIKSILLAGASKAPFPGWSRSEDRPLDEIYGAGRLDVFHSHRILTGGTHGPGTHPVPEAGWRVENWAPG